MVDNPRFPHDIKVFRALKDKFGNVAFDDNGEPAYTQILDSKCGIRTQSGNIRITKDVIEADYKLSLPRHTIDIQEGDICEVNTYTSKMRLSVVKSFTYNLGSNIWANKVAN